MSTVIAGPSQPSVVGIDGGLARAKMPKGKKERKSKHSKHTADRDGNDSDASMSSTVSSARESKEARKQRQRRGSDVSFASATSDAESATMDEGSEAERDDARAARIRKRKGKGPAVSALIELQPTIDIPIPPALCQDPHRAAQELIDTLLIRYVPQLGGVLLRHEDIEFTQTVGAIDGDGMFAVAPATMKLHVWAPKIGMRLEGRVILSTPSHISLLIHDKFNASITSAHLPSSSEKAARSSKETVYEWHEFDPEELDQDITMQKDAQQNGEEADEAQETEADGENGDDGTDALHRDEVGDIGEKSTGYWVNTKTGERLGGDDGKVVFTVVGLTIANNMLSVHGSLLRKPFSIPAPTYDPTLQSAASSSNRQSTTTANGHSAASQQQQQQEASRRVRFQDGHQTSEFQPYESSDDDDDEEDERYSSKVAANVVRPTTVQTARDDTDGHKKSKKKRNSKVGPKMEAEVSGSESEGESKREKKKRRKDA